MTALSKDAPRHIIDDFAKDIAVRKHPGKNPRKYVIDFRSEKKHGIERDAYLVPVELLRFRKDNGRIASDVLSYERAFGVLDETSESGQRKLKEFLLKKDPERTEDLKKSIRQQEQLEPAIVTCDGFLINGNRRKMVMEMLAEETGDASFGNMKVIILPGWNDPGGPPTIKEIEQIENRYQMQRDTKAEYSGLDKALSMRRKMECGISLKELLHDDPVNADLTEKQLQKEMRSFEEEFLEPLKCVDDYLNKINMAGHYSLVAEGLRDREGRWQAFKDYYKSVKKKIVDPQQRIKLNLTEQEIGKIEDVAFKIIRKRDFPELAKVHKIMRDLPKMIKNKDARKHLYELVNIDPAISEQDLTGEEGVIDPRTVDKKWAGKHHEQFMHRLKSAFHILQHKKERETSLALIEAALKKLQHEDMRPEESNQLDCRKAIDLLSQVEETAKALRSEFYHLDKRLKKLKEKNS